MKRILLLAFIGFMALAASAQLASPISLGVHGGWASTEIKMNSLKVGDTKISDISSSATGGYMFGIFARVNLGKLYIQPELNYSKKEGKINLPEDTSKIPSEYAAYAKTAADLSYSSIDIPILLGYKIVKLPFLNVHIFAGPVASFTLQSLDMKFDDAKQIAGEKSLGETVKDKFNPNKAMWNIKMGAGVEVWKLNLDFDYEMGLREFNTDLKAPQIFNITLGFRFI
jgi:hypothetical protein